MRYAAVTSVGSIRPENQDSVVIGRTLTAGAECVVLEGEISPTPAGALAAVIDGMGGHRGGREASTAVARSLLAREGLYGDHPPPAQGDQSAADAGAVFAMLTACDDAIHDDVARRPELRAMGATIAGLACLPGRTVVFNLGDARAYYYADGYLRRFSEDHRGPDGRLLQSLGGTVERVTLDPFAQSVPGDRRARWLLCSDGLSDHLPFLDLQEALVAGDPVSVAGRLLREALSAGSDDNVSIVILDA